MVSCARVTARDSVFPVRALKRTPLSRKLEPAGGMVPHRSHTGPTPVPQPYALPVIKIFHSGTHVRAPLSLGSLLLQPIVSRIDGLMSHAPCGREQQPNNSHCVVKV